METKKYIILCANVIYLISIIVWLYIEKSFEPIVAFIGGIISLITFYILNESSFIPSKQKNTFAKSEGIAIVDSEKVKIKVNKVSSNNENYLLEELKKFRSKFIAANKNIEAKLIFEKEIEDVNYEIMDNFAEKKNIYNEYKHLLKDTDLSEIEALQINTQNMCFKVIIEGNKAAKNNYKFNEKEVNELSLLIYNIYENTLKFSKIIESSIELQLKRSTK